VTYTADVPIAEGGSTWTSFDRRSVASNFGASRLVFRAPELCVRVAAWRVSRYESIERVKGDSETIAVADCALRSTGKFSNGEVLQLARARARNGNRTRASGCLTGDQ
jgi:hypothetical protein